MFQAMDEEIDLLLNNKKNAQETGAAMAAAVVAMLPCLLVFFLAQKWFVQGIATTGLKG